MKFSVGDRVKGKGICEHVGIATVVAVDGALGDILRVRRDGCQFPDTVLRAAELFEPHADVFPIAAVNDPWRESEPDSAHRYVGSCCYAIGPSHDTGRWVCTRDRHTDGHHISRDRDGTVCARWAKEAKTVEKSGPVVGMEVVYVGEARGEFMPGRRGTIQATDPGTFGVVFDLQPVRHFYAHAFGESIIPAAEWDARQQRDTGRAPANKPPFDRPLANDEVAWFGENDGPVYYGLHGHVRFVTLSGAYDVDWGPSVGNHPYEAHTFGSTVRLVSRPTSWETRDTTPCAAPTALGGDIAGHVGDFTVEAVREVAIPVPAALAVKPGQVLVPQPMAGVPVIMKRGALDEIVADAASQDFVRKLSRALFDLDFDEHACRVGDDGGGIGKAAALERMWDRVSDETRAVYGWRAAIVLKRAGELS